MLDISKPMIWTMNDADYGRAPVVCSDLAGGWWVAWISWDGRKERVLLSYKEAGDSGWSDPVDVSGWCSAITAVSFTPWREGVLLAWIDAGDGLKLRACGPGSLSNCTTVVPSRRIPAYVSVGSNHDEFILAWTVREPAGRRLEALKGSDPFNLPKALKISSQGGHHSLPSVTMNEDTAIIAWQEMGRHKSAVKASIWSPGAGPDEGITVAVHPQGTYAQPSVCPDKRGTWIGWQSDVKPNGDVGLVRWIEVAHLSNDGRLRRPARPMTDVDRDARGEDQGFEAPSLTVTSDGRLVVIGRGSQSLRCQELSSTGWTDRFQIDEKGWQCRGRRFDSCLTDAGLLVVGREKSGIIVRCVALGEPLDDGQPKLKKYKPEAPDESPISIFKKHSIAGERILFGDIHQHTMASDGTGTVEETMHRARYQYADDIVAVADHEAFLGKRTPPGEWAEACRVSDEACDPGAFVALHAFEWTGQMHPGPGHKVVYMPHESYNVLSRDDEHTNTSAGLMAKASRLGALVFPHHVGWTGADMKNHDDTVQTCWEIVSCHGAYERLGMDVIGTRGDDKEGQFIIDALDKGLRFGFVGGSDGHGLNWHHGVCRMADSHRSGLTGVLAGDVSREGILDALRRRRCYATSGAKISLWFEVDERPMGEELVSADPMPFRIVAKATDEIKSLAFVTNEGVELEFEVTGRDVEIRGALPPPPSERGWSYYFVRLIQQDGHVAWSSPVWMDSPDSA